MSLEKIKNIELSPQQWQKISEVMVHAETYQSIDLEDGFEMRFQELPHAGYSALLSHNHQDVFHFMWEEVSGLIHLNHRIVNPAFRGQGIGSKVLEAIEERVQRKANDDQTRYSLMFETSQLSVIKLGLKKGMKVTLGSEVYEDFEKNPEDYQIDQASYIRDKKNQFINVRLSKAFQPEQEPISNVTKRFRHDILNALMAA